MNLLFLFRDMGFKCLLKGAYKAREALFRASLGICPKILYNRNK